MNIPHSFPFDPSYGFRQEELAATNLEDEEPVGFVNFWQELKAKSDQVPLDLTYEEIPSPNPSYRYLKVFYTVESNYRIGAWMICPLNAEAVRFGIVIGHGYGGRETPEWEKAAPDRILLFPLMPGFQISADSRLPLNDSLKHVLHGIESKETYILGVCVCALWRSIDVLLELAPHALQHFHYIGWSFGGGLGALMLPWEPRFTSAELGQPTFGNHPLRLQCECVGSAESVRKMVAVAPEICNTLAFFDAAISARYLKIPIVFACATFDPAVPPPGQFSVANAHPGKKRISVFRTGHFDYHHDRIDAEIHTHKKHLQEVIGLAASGMGE